MDKKVCNLLYKPWSLPFIDSIFIKRKKHTTNTCMKICPYLEIIWSLSWGISINVTIISQRHSTADWHVHHGSPWHWSTPVDEVHVLLWTVKVADGTWHISAVLRRNEDSDQSKEQMQKAGLKSMPCFINYMIPTRMSFNTMS